MKYKLHNYFLLISICLFSSSQAFAQNATEPTIIGRVENVKVVELGTKAKARIDTGAGISSIDARIIGVRTPLEGGGERVMFEIKAGKKSKIIERKVVKWISIKGKGTAKVTRRPIVMLKFCIAGQILEGRVTLANRSEFLYPVLIGRNFLRMGLFLVDSHLKFSHKPTCK